MVICRENARFACAVVGSWLVHLTLGSFYSWANITPYVTSFMQWRGQDISYEASSRVFSLAGFCLGASMYFGGRLQSLIGSRGAALMGGLTLSLAVGLSSFTIWISFEHFVFTYSVMFGLGIGLAYTSPIVCLMRWLPDHKGFATGIVVLGFGTGASFVDPLQELWANPDNLTPELIEGDGAKYFDWQDPDVVRSVLRNIPTMFRWLSALYACMQVLGVSLLMDPLAYQAGSLSQPLTRPDRRWIQTKARNFSVAEMVRARQFWLLVASFAANTQAVFFVASFTKIVGEAFVDGSTDADLTKVAAVSSLFNGAGRILWGYLCDRSSFRASISVLCILQAVLLATLPLCSTWIHFCTWMSGIAFCCGGNYSLFPSATADYFGSTNIGSNYGVIFFGQSFAML
eukprot:TRINITY_DN73214_c0_g1_i1.p1 TRINITY_DN73214_c0_g1~~TRINITY_DN73214_c0_g1_i1.p1  ORF type:complete len:401 (+),score=43.59 TRINITY_DN73214_c0_g1_i1:103-1305(+)